MGIDSQKAHGNRGRNSCDPRPGGQEVPAASGRNILSRPLFQASSLGRGNFQCFKPWVSEGVQTSKTNVLAERESAFFTMRSETEKQKEKKKPRGNLQVDLKGLRDSNLEAMQQRYRGPSEDKEKFKTKSCQG